jgi:hypothetical protein
MVRNSCFVLALALAIFWAIGLKENHGATVLWFDAVAALAAFSTAALLLQPERNPSRAIPPALLGIGLAAVWLAGMSGHQPGWANWLNFVFAAAFLTVAVAALMQPRLVHVTR